MSSEGKRWTLWRYKMRDGDDGGWEVGSPPEPQGGIVEVVEVEEVDASEVERLREALRPFVRALDPFKPGVTLEEQQEARAALADERKENE